ncbi:hypothetical protein EPN44_09290 [bacterium]|nr:MAG: hypothetical protein EPN44_09290 [bacterium]
MTATLIRNSPMASQFFGAVAVSAKHPGVVWRPANALVPLSMRRIARSGVVMTNEDETMSRTEILDGFTAVMNAIERIDVRITQEIGGLRMEMRAGFAQVDRRLARLDDRVSVLEDRMGGLEDRVGGLERDMSRVKTHLGIVD